jgi:hypothetical protein
MRGNISLDQTEATFPSLPVDDGDQSFLEGCGVTELIYLEFEEMSRWP